MGRKVDCEVQAKDVVIDGRTVAGVCVTCTECDHEIEVAGTGGSSIRRGLATLRDECPHGESNYYTADDGDDR